MGGNLYYKRMNPLRRLFFRSTLLLQAMLLVAALAVPASGNAERRSPAPENAEYHASAPYQAHKHSTAHTPTTTLDAPFDHVYPARIDSLFDRWNRPDSPGCAVGVTHRGQLIFAQGYGSANLDYHIPITPRTRFMVASVSKQFAAAALHMMHQQQLLDLDRDIRPLLPELHWVGQPVTARQLMHHTSGIRDLYQLLTIADIGLDDTTTIDDMLELLQHQQQLNFRPGTQYMYSNMGYYLISVLAERRTGMSLQAYSHLHFFEPLGMRHTHWHDSTELSVPDRAISYRPMPFGPGRFYRDNLDRVGARGLFTTIEDFALWESNFLQNLTPLHNFYNLMRQPGRLSSGAAINYASGLRLNRHKTFSTQGHSGSYMGFRTDYVRFPQYQLAVMVFCNMSDINPHPLSRAVADLFLQPEIERALAQYQGVYKNEAFDTAFEVTLIDSDLWLLREEEAPRQLVWRGNDRFTTEDWTVVFRSSSSRRLHSFTLESARTGTLTFQRRNE